MIENYPTFHVLLYEFWAFAHAHPIDTFLILFLTAGVISWLGDSK